jgi:translation initiation factor IF-3
MKKELIINDAVIKATNEVRVIREGEQPVVMSANEALTQAENEGKDLIMVSPTAVPPVCKIVELNKYLYDMQKKEKQQKKNQKKTELKEIRLTPNIGSHDLETKINNANKFIGKGDRVQFTIVYKGREVAHINGGITILNDIASKMDGAKVEKTNIRSRNTLAMILVPAV